MSAFSKWSYAFFAAHFLGLYDAIETAEYFLRETNSEVNTYLNNIERTENEINSLYTKLENIKKEKIVKERELRERREKIEKLKMFQKNISFYSEHLRKWIQFVGETFSKTKILRTESTDLIFVDPLVTTIRDIAACIRKSSEDLSIYTELISFSVRSILFKYVFTSELVSRRKYSAVSMASYNPKKCAAKNPINGIEKKPLSASLLLLRSSL
jgi:hypothetical protein